MDIHDKIQYTAIIAAVSAVAYVLTPSTLVSKNLSKDLEKIDKHEVNIFCAPGYCGLADKIADQFEIAKWVVHVQPAIDANYDIGVKGPTVLQQILSQNVKEPVKLQLQSGDRPWEIWIGKPSRKSVS